MWPLISDLSSGLDPFKDAEINNGPGQNKKAEKFPANPSGILNALCHVEHLTAKKICIKDINNINQETQQWWDNRPFQLCKLQIASWERSLYLSEDDINKSKKTVCYSLKELLTCRLQMCGITGKTSGTVATCVPRIVAGVPWQRGAERVEQVVKGPRHEDIVVGAEHKWNDHCRESHTWGQTGGDTGKWDTSWCNRFQSTSCQCLACLPLLDRYTSG